MDIRLERLAKLIANRLNGKEGCVVEATGSPEVADQGFIHLLNGELEKNGTVLIFEGLGRERARSLRELMGQMMVDIKMIDTVKDADYIERWMHLLYPTDALLDHVAATMKMSKEGARDFVFSLLLVNNDHAIEKHKEIEAFQQSLVDILDYTSELKIVGEKTNLKMSIKGRKAVNECGWDEPTGEVLTSCDEDSVEGPYLSHAPYGLILFKNGKIVTSKFFTKDEAYKKEFDRDKNGESRRVGEVAFGGNPYITKLLNGKFCGDITIANEKKIGTFHLGIGNGYLKTGSKNVSSVHLDFILDLVKDNAKVYLDGRRLVISPKGFYLKK